MRFVVAALLAPALAFAQAEPDQSLVKLNVVATTGKGQPPTDLKASDIRIKEDGALRPIEFFRFAGRKSAPTVILLDRALQALHPDDSDTVKLP